MFSLRSDPSQFAKKQNCTVAVSFGGLRECSFLHSRNGAHVSIPQANGMLYAFGRDVNIEWKHGVLPIPPEQQQPTGRVSIIAWGWVDQADDGTRHKQRFA